MVHLDNTVSLDPKRRSGAILASKLHAAGIGQVMAEQAIMQDRAYWEVTVEGTGAPPQLAVGVASRAHVLGTTLGDCRNSWVLDSAALPVSLAHGDVIGITLDQSDYPVSLRFSLNGNQCAEVKGPSTEATPIVQLRTVDAAVAVNFGATDFTHRAPMGYSGLIKSRSIL